MQKYLKNLTNIFGLITDLLNLYELSDVRVCEELEDIDNIVYKFRNHSSIVKIKERYKVKGNVSVRPTTTEEIRQSLKIFLRIKQLAVKYQ